MLSSNGGLTFSQKKGLDNVGQAKKLIELSKLSLNKPILERVAHVAEERKKAAIEKRNAAETRRTSRFRDKPKAVAESTLD